MRKLSWICVLVWVSGCGDDDAPPPDSAVITTDGAPAVGPCGTSPPDNATSCPRIGLVCEYGDDPREECHTLASCEASGQWQLTSPRCTALPPVTCPATREAAAGMDCTPMDAWCTYADLGCHCTNCREFPIATCAGPLKWVCDTPNADPACPAGKPAKGASCAQNGQVCRYECGSEGGRTCQAGAWVASEGGPCPISTRRAKRDISYLTPAELATLAHAAESIPLATWEYIDPTLGPGRRLGFIIEDQPPGSPAVEPGRQMVNEYGYTSMLLAALQAQRRELDELRQEVAALKAAVSARSAGRPRARRAR